MLASGLFYSKLTFSLPVIAEVWKKELYKDKNEKRTCTTREDYRKLQVLQNRLERIIYARNNNVNEKTISQIPTEELLKSNNMMSIHQMGAVSILTTHRKILTTKKPTQLHRQLVKSEGRHGAVWKVDVKTPKLTTTGSNFIMKSTKLWNDVEIEVKETTSQESFKRKMKMWAKENIPIKPG